MKAWSASKMAVVVLCLIIGLVFFWLGVGIWIIPAAGLIGFAAMSV